MKTTLASFLFAGCLLPVFAALEFKLDGHQLVLPSPITFKADTAELDEPSSKPALEHIRQYLAAKTYISKLRIEAHTDSGGDAAANQRLTEQRALAVARWLKTQGADCQRLLAVGFGGTKPVADNSSAAGRAENRRISVVNAELRGRAIGGLPTDGGGRVAGNPCD